MSKFVASALASCVILLSVDAKSAEEPPPMNCSPPNTEGNAKYFIIPAFVIGVADLYGIGLNTRDLATHQPSSKSAYFGIITGVVSIAFGFVVQDAEGIAAAYAFAGTLSVGFGAFNLRSAHRPQNRQIEAALYMKPQDGLGNAESGIVFVSRF